MTLPDVYLGNLNNLDYYQGVIVAEISVTLGLYIALRIVHYIKWGYDEQAAQEQKEAKPEENKVQSAEEDTTTKVIL